MDDLMERVGARKRLEEDTESVDTNCTQSTTLSDEADEDKKEPFTIMATVVEDAEEGGTKPEGTLGLGPWQLRWVNCKIWLDTYGLRWI